MSDDEKNYMEVVKDDVAEEKAKVIEVKDKQPKSRAEQRAMERITKEASDRLMLLADKWLDFITTTDDPEGEEAVAKFNQLDAQWRTYCTAKRLLPAVFVSLKNYMTAIIEEYKISKAGGNDPGKELADELEEAAKGEPIKLDDLEKPQPLEENKELPNLEQQS